MSYRKDKSAKKRMSTCFLVVLCGVPACGKTTLADALLTECTLYYDGTVEGILFSFDRMYPPPYQWSAFDAGEWQVQQKSFRSEIEKALRVRQSPDWGRPRRILIVDDNNFYRSMRDSFRRMATAVYPSCSGPAVVVVKCPLAESLRRNAQRVGTAAVPEHVIRRMVEKFEGPVGWEVRNSLSLELGAGGLDAKDAAKRVIDFVLTLSPPPEGLPAAPPPSKQSLLHHCDVRLRKCVGRAIKEARSSNESNELEAYATKMHDRKLQCLAYAARYFATTAEHTEETIDIMLSELEAIFFSFHL